MAAAEYGVSTNISYDMEIVEIKGGTTVVDTQVVKTSVALSLEL